MQNIFKTKETLTFEEKYNYKDNSMDILRLLLAIIIIYGHTYPILYGPKLASPRGRYDIVAMLSKNQIGSGTIAVYIFFIISGFLITQSMINSKNNIEYLLKRALRIIPALFGSLCLSTFLIGPIVTKLSLADYFHNTGNPFAYFFYNLTLSIFGFYYSLADVFSTNPFPNSINASMWTLPNEVACYLLVVLLSTYNFFKRRERMIHLYIVVLILVYYNIKFGYTPITLNDNFWVLGTSNISGFINVSYYFIAGSLIYCYKDKIRYNKNIFIILATCLLITIRFGCVKYSLLICLPYVTMFICMIKPFVNLKKIGDFSYGAYIYAFPIQQFLVYYLQNRLKFIPFFILSTLCILCVSVVSWFLIEKPALNLKNKL